MDSWEKDESGYPIGKCNSLSNIYYGKIVKLFPFKQIKKKKNIMKQWIKNMKIVV